MVTVADTEAPHETDHYSNFVFDRGAFPGPPCGCLGPSTKEGSDHANSSYEYEYRLLYRDRLQPKMMEFFTETIDKNPINFIIQ